MYKLDHLGLNEELLTREFTIPINPREELEGGYLNLVALGVPDHYGGESHNVYGRNRFYESFDKLRDDMLATEWDLYPPYLKFVKITFNVDMIISLNIQTLKNFIAEDDNIEEITIAATVTARKT